MSKPGEFENEFDENIFDEDGQIALLRMLEFDEEAQEQMLLDDMNGVMP